MVILNISWRAAGATKKNSQSYPIQNPPPVDGPYEKFEIIQKYDGRIRDFTRAK